VEKGRGDIAGLSAESLKPLTPVYSFVLLYSIHNNANIVPGRPLTLISNPENMILMSRKKLDINLKI
jgi:hypothetical protein